MITTVINLINRSTLITDADLFTITGAINLVLPTFCTSWNISLPKCQFIAKGKTIPPGLTNVYVMDTPDVSGAFGYHLELNDLAVARVFVKVILDNGGGIMTGKRSPVSVSQVISHEIFELLADPLCNSWWNTPDYSKFYAWEVCDPVQGNRITVFSNKTSVTISDWILPAWSDPQNTKGPFNYTKTLKGPFQVAPNGYVISCTSGDVSYVFGNTIPEWLKNSRISANRVSLRLSVPSTSSDDTAS